MLRSNTFFSFYRPFHPPVIIGITVHTGDPLRGVLRYGSVGVEEACEIRGNIETGSRGFGTKLRDGRTRGKFPAPLPPTT